MIIEPVLEKMTMDLFSEQELKWLEAIK